MERRAVPSVPPAAPGPPAPLQGLWSTAPRTRISPAQARRARLSTTRHRPQHRQIPFVDEPLQSCHGIRPAEFRQMPIQPMCHGSGCHLALKQAQQVTEPACRSLGRAATLCAQGRTAGMTHLWRAALPSSPLCAAGGPRRRPGPGGHSRASPGRIGWQRARRMRGRMPRHPTCCLAARCVDQLGARVGDRIYTRMGGR